MPHAARSISTHDTAERRKSTAVALLDVPRENMIRGMPDLLDVLRARREEVGITLETMDHVAGFVSGYSAKLLAPVAIKNLGWMSFGAALGSLGIALIAVVDEEQVRRVAKRWAQRERPPPAPRKEHRPRLASSRK